MKLESRRCWKRWPRRRGPATGVTPRRWRISPGAVEDRDLQPRVGAPVAGGPDDRADALAAQVEAGQPLGGRTPGGRRRAEDLGVEAAAASMWSSMRASRRASRSSAAAVVPAGRRRTSDAVAVDADEPAGEPHAEPLERGQVDVAVVLTADELQRALVAAPGRVGDLVDRLGERADLVEPPPDVHPPVAAGNPAVTADGEHDLPAGAGELVGDLDAGGGGAHDEHPARRGAGPGCGRRSGVSWATSDGAGRRPAARAAGRTSRWRSRRWPARPRRRRSCRTVKPSSARRASATSLCSSTGASNEPA